MTPKLNNSSTTLKLASARIAHPAFALLHQSGRDNCFKEMSLRDSLPRASLQESISSCRADAEENKKSPIRFSGFYYTGKYRSGARRAPLRFTK